MNFDGKTPNQTSLIEREKKDKLKERVEHVFMDSDEEESEDDKKDELVIEKTKNQK
jgi:hypothetical protein